MELIIILSDNIVGWLLFRGQQRTVGECRLNDRTFKQIPHFSSALFNRLTITSGGAFVPVAAPRFHSRMQVSICFLSRSSYTSSRPVSAFLLPCPLPDPQNASPECRRGETLDSQIIESNNEGQFLFVARRIGRSPSSAFVTLRNSNPLSTKLSTLIVNGSLRTTSTEPQILILERYLRGTSPSIPNNRLPFRCFRKDFDGEWHSHLISMLGCDCISLLNMCRRNNGNLVPC